MRGKQLKLNNGFPEEYSGSLGARGLGGVAGTAGVVFIVVVGVDCGVVCGLGVVSVGLKAKFSMLSIKNYNLNTEITQAR